MVVLMVKQTKGDVEQLKYIRKELNSLYMFTEGIIKSLQEQGAGNSIIEHNGQVNQFEETM